MKIPFYALLYCLVLASIVSCNSSNQESDSGKIVDKTLDSEASMEAEIKSIDEEISAYGQLLSSFRFSKENGAMVLAHAHLSTKGFILKIDEEYNMGNDGDYGMNSFYLKNDKVFATREYYEDRSDKSKPCYIERVSYYDKNGKVIKTLEKKVDFEEKIDTAPFKPAPLKGIKIDRAKRALDQEGEFSTFFQGFAEANAINYIILGGNEKDAFSSTVRVDREDGFVALLLANQDKCMGKKLKIAFKNITDDTGFEYQAYIQGGFVD